MKRQDSFTFRFFGENHWSWNEVKLNYTRLKKVEGENKQDI